MEKVLYLSIVLCLLNLLDIRQQNQNDADRIVGVYWSPKKDAKIKIFKGANKYFGKFIWTSQVMKDIKNPNRSLRKRDLLSVVFLTNFNYYKGIYRDGEVYDPECGKTYDCKMTLIGDDLKVAGFYGLSQIRRIEIFERVL